MRFLIRALVVFFVISAMLSIVRGLLAPSKSKKERQQVRGKLTKDPVCGTYVAEASALNANGSFFCSEDCRRKFLES
jgi:hypothetical protein